MPIPARIDQRCHEPFRSLTQERGESESQDRLRSIRQSLPQKLDRLAPGGSVGYPTQEGRRACRRRELVRVGAVQLSHRFQKPGYILLAALGVVLAREGPGGTEAD